MTLQEIQALTDDEIRVRVAQLCGFADRPVMLTHEWRADGLFGPVRNYHADLNACHEAILACGFSIHQQDQFSFELWKIIRLYRQASTDKVGSIDFLAVNATARQRCEAFLAVMQP